MDQSPPATREIVFFLVPNFSLLAFATAIEPLRLANRFLQAPAYSWRMISANGEQVRASNGLLVNVDGSIADMNGGRFGVVKPELLLVCAGLEVEKFKCARLNRWLRRLHGAGANIGGLCTGAWVLAQADLLDGRRCAIHWENLPGFHETFPGVDIYADLFEVDGHVYTCAGGTAALDMILHIIQEHFGEEIVTRVCEQCLIDRARSPTDRQRMPLRARLGVHNTKLLFIIELMEANLTEPLTLKELSQYAGLSRRHIERLFRQNLGRSPARYYLDLRLDRARHLLMSSDMAVIDVAVACGFISASHFSKCYREIYGRPPQTDRFSNAVASRQSTFR